MRRVVVGIVLLSSLMGCREATSSGGDVSIEQKYVTYKTGDNRYTIIYVEMNQTSSEEALKYAKIRAAQLAQDQGYRYFTIDSQKEVVVAHTAPSPSTQQFHQNLYQELIVEGDFGRNPYDSGEYPQSAHTLPGMKITITCYHDHPGREAVDICTLIDCSR